MRHCYKPVRFGLPSVLGSHQVWVVIRVLDCACQVWVPIRLPDWHKLNV